MKNTFKIFTLLFVAISFIACMSRQEDEEVYETSTDIVWYNDGIITSGLNVTPFEYNGHKYIMFGFGDGKAIVHNPDCHCNNSNIEYNINSDYNY